MSQFYIKQKFYDCFTNKSCWNKTKEIDRYVNLNWLSVLIKQLKVNIKTNINKDIKMSFPIY